SAGSADQMVVVALVAHRVAMTAIQVDAAQYAALLQQLEGAIDGGSTDAARTQFIDEAFGVKGACLCRDRSDDRLTLPGEAQPVVSKPSQDLIRARAIGRTPLSSHHPRG